MKNDNEERIYDIISTMKDNIFISEYKKLKNNHNFNNWENSIFNKYGNDAKLFLCHKGWFFYISNKECTDYFICYFYPIMENREKSRRCRIWKMFFIKKNHYSFYQDSHIFYPPKIIHLLIKIKDANEGKFVFVMDNLFSHKTEKLIQFYSENKLFTFLFPRRYPRILKILIFNFKNNSRIASWISVHLLLIYFYYYY